MQDLTGNGLHLAAYGAWKLYVASHVVRRDVLSAMPPPITYRRSDYEEYQAEDTVEYIEESLPPADCDLPLSDDAPVQDSQAE